jgi:hypothetical protein
LRVLSPGGGAHRTSRFIVRLPETIAESATVTESATVADTEKKPLLNPDETVADFGQNHCRIGNPKREKREIKRPSKEGASPVSDVGVS